MTKNFIIVITLIFILAGCGEVAKGSSGGTSVANSPPQIVSLYIDNNNINAPSDINFQATVQDPDETAASLQYIWDFGDGTTSNQTEPNHTYTYQGNFTYSLTVYDSSGSSDFMSGTSEINVIGGNNRPQITIFTYSKVTADILEELNFTGEGIDSDLGNSLIFTWNFGDGTVLQGQNVSHSFTEQGLYNVSLSLADQHGATDQESVLIGIETNVPPNITQMSWTPTTNTDVPVTINFTGAASDPNGSIASYLWDFGDGGSSSDQNPAYVYQYGGDFLVKLTVEDDEGLTIASQNYITIYSTEE